MTEPRPTDPPTVSWSGDASQAPQTPTPHIEGYEVLGRLGEGVRS